MPDVFLHVPEQLTKRLSGISSSDADTSSNIASQHITLLYFIPGNPGLIEYYFPFLTLLSDGSCKNVLVAGASLGGFEAGSSSAEAPSQSPSRAPTDDGFSLPLYPASFERKDVYNLRDQIELTYQRIIALTSQIHGLQDGEAMKQNDHDREQRPSAGRLPISVILAGHSVGAYIALEVIQKLYEDHHHHSTKTTSPQSAAPPPPAQQEQHQPNFSITSTLLLTPTIQNIALSRSGRLATPLLTLLPGFPSLVQLAAWSLTSSIPKSWLEGIVATATGMKSPEMVRVTAEFLRRDGAVRQALFLAGWEMREIGEVRWLGVVGDAAEVISTTTAAVARKDGNEVGDGDGVVGALGKGKERGLEDWRSPLHHFLFAKEDHWVADETREAIVLSMDGKAKIVVDTGESELVHAWCLEQSEMVAGIVDGWIANMLIKHHDHRHTDHCH